MVNWLQEFLGNGKRMGVPLPTGHDYWPSKERLGQYSSKSKEALAQDSIDQAAELLVVVPTSNLAYSCSS
jgi:hypothetical protein